MALREVLAKFGVKVDDKALDKLDKKFGGIIKTVGRVAGALGIAFSLGAIKAFAEEQAKTADEISNTAQKIKISADELQRWRHAANMSGVSSSALEGAITKLNESIAQTTKAGSEQEKAFEELGISLTDANGNARSTSDIFKDVGNSLHALDDQNKAAYLSNKLLGGSANEINAIFAQGPEAVRGMLNELDDLGAIIEDELLEKYSELNNENSKLDAQMRAVKMRVAGHILPIIIRLKSVIISVVVSVSTFIRENRRLVGILTIVASTLLLVRTRALLLRTAMKLLGTESIKTWLKISAPILLIVGLVYLLYIGVKDFFGFLDGKDSLFGRLLEDIFGKEKTEKIRESINKMRDNIRKAFDKITGGIFKGMSVFKIFGKVIGAIVEGIVIVIGFLVWAIIAVLDQYAWFVNEFREFWKGIKEMFSDAIDWIGEKWDEFVEWIKGAVDDIGTWIKNFVNSIVDGIADLFNSLKDKAKAGVNAALDALKSIPGVGMALNMMGGSAGSPAASAPGSGGGIIINQNVNNTTSVGITGAQNPNATGKAVAGAANGAAFNGTNRATHDALSQRRR